MIVGICGLGWTGSGAVKDLLTEFDEITNVGKKEGDYEFNFVYRPDGILDLRYFLFEGACRDNSSKIAFHRFVRNIARDCETPSRIQKITDNRYKEISKEYVEAISQIRFQDFVLREYIEGGWLKNFEGRVRYKLQRILNKKCDHFVPAFPLKECYFSIRPDDFENATKKYIAQIIEAMGVQKGKIILLDQPFSGDCPSRSMKYFEDPYAIVVDRDPRDLFLMMKRVCFLGGEMVNDVQNFITYYQKIRENMEKDNNERVLHMKFEDLIYKYDETVAQIQNFLGISCHSNPKKYFDPSVSIKNTQLWNRFPEELENIKCIEKELQEWLYPFDYSIEVSTKGKCF